MLTEQQKQIVQDQNMTVSEMIKLMNINNQTFEQLLIMNFNIKLTDPVTKLLDQVVLTQNRLEAFENNNCPYSSLEFNFDDIFQTFERLCWLYGGMCLQSDNIQIDRQSKKVTIKADTYEYIQEIQPLNIQQNNIQQYYIGLIKSNEQLKNLMESRKNVLINGLEYKMLLRQGQNDFCSKDTILIEVWSQNKFDFDTWSQTHFNTEMQIEYYNQFQQNILTPQELFYHCGQWILNQNILDTNQQEQLTKSVNDKNYEQILYNIMQIRYKTHNGVKDSEHDEQE